MNAKEFLLQHLTEGKSYQQIADENNLPRTTLTLWGEEGLELRERIKRSNQLFNGRKDNPHFDEFAKMGKRKFFEWFEDHGQSCDYCGIAAVKLKALFDYETGILGTKRGRGRVLELERRDAKGNRYNPENCVLICYLCNNHKSDLISEADHREYFAPAIRKYLEDKYLETPKS